MRYFVKETAVCFPCASELSPADLIHPHAFVFLITWASHESFLCVLSLWSLNCNLLCVCAVSIKKGFLEEFLKVQSHMIENRFLVFRWQKREGEGVVEYFISGYCVNSCIEEWMPLRMV